MAPWMMMHWLEPQPTAALQAVQAPQQELPPAAQSPEPPWALAAHLTMEVIMPDSVPSTNWRRLGKGCASASLSLCGPG